MVALAAIKLQERGRPEANRDTIILYEPLAHPYLGAVGAGAEAYGRDAGVPVRLVVGQESTQANVNTNVESLFTVGYQAFAIYPVDPAGSKGLFHRLRQGGRLVVAYGAQPEAGTDIPFAVGSDVRHAATLAADKLAACMGERGRVLDVLESLTDANTPIRRAAVEAALAKYPGMQIIQTVGDVTTEQKAREKIESALVARGDEVDGVICTGYTTTVAAALLLSAHNRQPGARRVHFVGSGRRSPRPGGDPRRGGRRHGGAEPFRARVSLLRPARPPAAGLAAGGRLPVCGRGLRHRHRGQRGQLSPRHRRADEEPRGRAPAKISPGARRPLTIPMLELRHLSKSRSPGSGRWTTSRSFFARARSTA